MRFGIEKKGERKTRTSERASECARDREREGERERERACDVHETRSEGEGDSGANIPTD